MGRTRGPYEAEFPIGTTVRIIDEQALEHFRTTWRFHHPVSEDQVQFAGREARVRKVSFYHGGDELYSLQDVPGLWHEQCLSQASEPGAA